MSIRTERVAGVIQKELSELLTRDVETSGYGLVTVTEVIMTADLRLAKVYVSFYATEKTREECMAFIESHAKSMRQAIGRVLRIKFTPELRFYYDETLDKVDRIEELLRQVRKEESGR